MPTSSNIFKSETVSFITQRFSNSIEILDVGAGNGVYSTLLRDRFPNIDAVEVFEPYVTTYNLRDKYRTVTVADITSADIELQKYSLFILGDVLEHIAEQEAMQLIQTLHQTNAEIVVAVPFNSPQTDTTDNLYERHLQPRLTFPRMMAMYPELTPLCLRHDYGVFVTNRSENTFLPIFYKDLSDEFVDKLRQVYPLRALVDIDTPTVERPIHEVFTEVRNKEVTIVTGLWDMGRGELGSSFARSYDSYKIKFAELLKAPVNMVIYVAPEDEAFIWEHRTPHNTFVKTMDLTEFDTWFEFFEQVQAIRNNPTWRGQVGWLPASPQATLPHYNPVVMSKMFLLHNAMLYNPFESDYYYWIDAGITNTVHPGYFTHDKVFDNLPDYTDRVGGFTFISYPYEGGTEIHGFPRSAIAKYCGTEYVKYVCRGGFFGGARTDITALNSIYHRILASTLHDGVMGTEESVFTIISHKFPEMIARHEIASDGLVWPFFEQLKNVTSAPVTNVVKSPTWNTVKNSLYVLTFNSPVQLQTTLESIQVADPEFFINSRKILINNSTDESTFAEYDILCQTYGFEEIHRENLGVCGGRQFAAEHFDASDTDFYMFFEDDMQLNGPDTVATVCRNGFRQYIPDLYQTVVKIMLAEQIDFLKFSFSEFYGDNSVQWSWYNVPQEVRSLYWPTYDKLPHIGIDPNAPRTEFKYIKTLDGIPYITGEIYYSNWPQIVSRAGNKKMFLDTTWSRPFEQTWMSHMFQLTRKNELTPAVLLASPVTHNRFDFYDGTLRKES